MRREQRRWKSQTVNHILEPEVIQEPGVMLKPEVILEPEVRERKLWPEENNVHSCRKYKTRESQSRRRLERRGFCRIYATRRAKTKRKLVLLETIITCQARN